MTLERLNYFPGQRLDAADLRAEQGYHLLVRRLLNKGLFTPGVVSGLEVDRVEGQPRSVRVADGLALDPLGRAVVLLEEETVVAVPNQPPASTPGYYYLLLRYGEETVAGAGRACAPLGDAPPSRVAERPSLHFSERLPDPRRCEQDPDSLDCAVTLALVNLDAACQVKSIESGLRQYSYPTHTSRVQAVAIEGDQDIDSRNPKRLYFHVRGGPPTSVVLYVRGGRFSSLHYTEVGSHAHALSGVTINNHSVALQGHAHTMDQHQHATTDAQGDSLMSDNGSHDHAIWTRALVDKDHPRELIATYDNPFSKDYAHHGWTADSDDNPVAYPNQYLQMDGTHRHTYQVPLGGATSTGGVVSSQPAEYAHTFSATVNPAGSTGYPAPGGVAYTWLDDLRVLVDGTDITERILDLQPNRWQQFGGRLGHGGAGHPLNTDGTGAIDLLELGMLIDEGREHLIEFRVPEADPSAIPPRPPNGGKVLYQLYVE